MGTSNDDNVLPAHGPKHEGIDPLSTGETTYGEDVKGNSNYHDTPESDTETPDEAPAKPASK